MTTTDVSLHSHLLSHDLSSHPALLDASFAAIDWAAPWLTHINGRSDLARQITKLSATINNTNAAHLDRDLTIIAEVLNAQIERTTDANHVAFITKPTADNVAQPLKFVSQKALPAGQSYEYFIGTTGQIPTRNNLHDLFNGSIWLSFPKTKALLNYYHMLKIAAGHEDGKDTRRGRVRDTITVFDENGAILVTADDSIGEALSNFDWQNTLVDPRKHWDHPSQPSKDAKVAAYIFGHALLEQLVTPRKPLCAHSVIIHVSQDFFALSMPERMAFLDDILADYMDELLAQEDITPRHLSPLPILGVPHFWADNRDPNFYDDDFVFRRGRHRQK